MRAERFGSYSIVATLAGISSLFRLKSILRYWRLCPPPWCRVVMRPLLLRPPRLGSGSNSDFSGAVLVISAKSETVWNRRPGEVGLYFFSPMSSPSVRWPSRLGLGATRTGDSTPDYHGAGWLHIGSSTRPPGSGSGVLPALEQIDLVAILEGDDS